jgi:CTP:molybdopterin cytidylyltransferase MocA
MILPAKTAAIILAAGYSRRMGRFKPLLALGGRPMIDWGIDLFRACDVSAIHVVAGHRHDALAPVLAKRGVAMVVNPDFQEGMFSSVKAGIRALSPACGAFFILPADIPLVRPATVRRLLACFDARRAKVVVPSFACRPGHPPLVSGELASSILEAQGSEGLRGVLAQWRWETATVPVPDRFILHDADAPEDHQALEAACHRWGIPDDGECDAILARPGPDAERILRHGREVARVADVMTAALRQAGFFLDPHLVHAAARVHDLAKGKPDHARVGAERLRALGFDAVAEIVACHHDIVIDPQQPINAAEIVYLADRRVAGERLVPLEERFAAALERYGKIADARVNIHRRRAQALGVQARIEAALGRSVDALLSSPSQDGDPR